MDPALFEYIDVTDDPDAPLRARVSEESVAAAHGAGFSDLGWIAAVMAAPYRGVLVSRVLRNADGTTLLALTHTAEEHWTLQSVFADGSILTTERVPPGFYKKSLARALKVPPLHRFDLAVIAADDLGALLAIHEARRAESASAGLGRLVGSLDLHVAIRKRYRQIADQRHVAQHAFAHRAAEVVFYVVFASGVAASAIVAARAGFGRLGINVIVPLLTGVLGAAVLGETVQRVAPRWIWPLLRRDAGAPPPPDVDALLALSDDLRRGRLPSRDSPPKEKARATAPGGTVAVPTDSVARLRRRDLIASIANVLLMPALGLAFVAALGKSGSAAAVGCALCIDAVLLFLRDRFRIDVVRARLVPELFEAEDAAGLIARPPRWLRWIMLGIGLLALVVARHSVMLGRPPVERWDYMQWVLVAMVFVWSAARSARRRHARIEGR